jgi:hypothetical protein
VGGDDTITQFLRINVNFLKVDLRIISEIQAAEKLLSEGGREI